MTKYNFDGPSRKEFIQLQMVDAPRFSLFPVGTKLPYIQEDKILPRSFTGFATLMTVAGIDTLLSGSISDRLGLTSNHGAIYSSILYALGYAGFSLVEHLIEKGKFENNLEAAANSEYGQRK